jgi:hypothetical protein
MRRFGAVLALLAVTAAGCSDDRAGTLPTEAPTTTTTAPGTTTSASPTAVPGGEVEAAARAYYAALETGGTTGDVTALRAIVDGACDCTQQITTIEAERKAGRRFTTRYTVDAVTLHDVTATTAWATVTISYAASQVVDASGRVVRKIPGNTRAGRDLLFRKEGTAWRLVHIVLLG